MFLQEVTMLQLTLQRVRDYFSQPLNKEQFELIGAEFEEDTVLPDMELEFANNGKATVFLVIDPDREKRRIEFDDTFHPRLIPDFGISLRDLIEDDLDQAKELIGDAVLTVLKPLTKIKIERPEFWNDEIELTITISHFSAGAKCEIDDLRTFISPKPENEAQWKLRQIDSYADHR